MFSQVSFREGIPNPQAMNQYQSLACQEPGPIAEGELNTSEVSSIFTATPHHLNYLLSSTPCSKNSVSVTHLNYPKPIHTLCSLEKLFSTKPVPDAKKVEDHCCRGWQILLLLCCWVFFFNRLLMNTWILSILVHKKEASFFWCTRKRSRNPMKKKQVWVLACGFYALLLRVLKMRNLFAILAENLTGAAGTLVFLSLSGPFQVKPWIWNRDLDTDVSSTSGTHWEITLCLLGGKADLKFSKNIMSNHVYWAVQMSSSLK